MDAGRGLVGGRPYLAKPVVLADMLACLERHLGDARSVAVRAIREGVLSALNRVDATGVEMFTQMRKLLAERGVTLHLVGLKLPVERVLDKAGALQESPLLKMYRTDADAFLDFLSTRSEVAVRSRLPGDRFHPLGARVAKRFKAMDANADGFLAEEERSFGRGVGDRALGEVGAALDDAIAAAAD